MNNIEITYSLTREIFRQNIEKIIADGVASMYPQSHKALFYCQDKIDCLLNCIMLLNNQENVDNYYSIQVITRVFVEHFIIGHYIWTKTRIEQNDNCGVEYYAYYRVSELLKRENYDLGIEGIERNEKKYVTFENLQKRLEGYENPITPADIQEIHRIANQFDIKQIFHYVLNLIPNNEHFIEVHKSFAHFLRMYNNLSSFIHNGPSAEYETYHNEPKKDKGEVVNESINYAKIASRVLKEHIMMLFAEEKPEYFALLEPIMELKKEKK